MSVARDDAYRAFSFRRIGAMVLRYWYLLRSSWPRILELIYWPMVQMLMWGFLQLYVVGECRASSRARAAPSSARCLLWDILFRGQLGFSVSFLEEMWARNMGNLMMSPLRPGEFVVALMIMSLVRLAIGMVPVTLLAMAFFDFNLYAIGLRARRLFRQSDLDELGRRHPGVGTDPAQRHGRRGLRLDHHVPAAAADLRLLPGVDPARLAAGHRLGAAADLCVRGHAGAADRPGLPRRPDAAGAGA